MKPRTYSEQREQKDGIVERMRQRLAEVFGVTVVGDRVTVRWHETDDGIDSQLVDVHMVILDITTMDEARDRGKVHERYKKLYEKYPGLEAELYFADEGEWPK